MIEYRVRFKGCYMELIENKDFVVFRDSLNVLYYENDIITSYGFTAVPDEVKTNLEDISSD